MTRYAQKTTVSVAKSKAEIEMTLARYGADQFVSGWDADKAYVGFRVDFRMVKLVLVLPERSEFRFTEHTHRARSAQSAEKAWEQACRQRWRALALVVKAKLEAVEAGISTFENEFLANVVLPNGATVGEWAGRQIQRLSGAKMPPLLPVLEGGESA